MQLLNNVVVYIQAKSEWKSACEVTSLKADVSPGLPPPSMRTPGFGANPWERTEGSMVPLSALKRSGRAFAVISQQH